MKFIGGNSAFVDNIKQLLPDSSIFNRIISDEPSVLENSIWRKKIGLTSMGITSGSLINQSDNVFFRSCYMIYKSGNHIVEGNLSMTVKNIHSNENLSSDDFKNWGMIQIDNNMYILFVWIDIEQSFTFNLTGNLFNSNDWFIQVVI